MVSFALTRLARFIELPRIAVAGSSLSVSAARIPLLTLTARTMASASNRQPAWHKPAPGGDVPVLKLFNTLTHNKEVFVPANGRQVTWYNCGPTVYDSAHIGHARNYVSIDIMRRVLEEYFGYDVQFVMNITDIDDKIILRARQAHLYEQFRKRHLDAGAGLSEEAREQVRELWKNYVARNFGDAAAETWPAYHAAHAEAESGDLVTDAKKKLKLKQAETAFRALESTKSDSSVTALESVLESSRDIIAPALDAAHGHTVSDHQIFRDLAAFWEADFMSDMDALGVRGPDVLTRVSEYVPEIVTFVEKIIENGFAYEVDGSIYFDTRAFHQHPDHSYAKLEPWSANSEALVAEGEGDLSTNLTKSKRAPADFALWKKSKTGEPSWPSPWGQGRPGWHIECSVMASAVTGEHLDIHSGGSDLAFPHHDNEIAQSEAHFGCKQWVNYFLHVGHLHVEGQKMSKSLKNFTTIKEALAQHKASTLRMMYLQQHWQSTMDFKAAAAAEAQAAESTFRNFATNVRAILADLRANPPPFNGKNDFRAREAELLAHLQAAQRDVHAALCDNLNTPLALSTLLDLVSKANVYLRAVSADALHPNPTLLAKIAKYVTRMTKVFGLTDAGADIGYGVASEAGEGAGSREDAILPYLHVLSKFRDDVRAAARGALASGAAAGKDLLALCDDLRDNTLPDMGVVLDDRDEGRALVKLVDPAELAAERADKKKREDARAAAKAESQRKVLVKKLERLHRGRVAHVDMFRGKPAEFSQFDADGVPTHDAEGAELPKSRRKKLAKESDAQRKLHEEYLAAKAEGEIDWEPLRADLEAQGKTLEM